MKKLTSLLSVVLIVFGGYYFVYYYPEKRSPEKIFTTAWAGMNQVSIHADFAESFERYREIRQNGNFKIFKNGRFVDASSYVEYFTENKILLWYEKRIKELKKLKPQEDAQALVATAIDLYRLMDEIYKTDFLRVAEMIDAGVPDEQTNAYLDDLAIEKGEEISEKYNKLFDLITAYGDKHGIKYSVNDYVKPF